MAFLGEDEQIREMQFKFRYLYLGLAIAFFILLSRLWWLQIIQGENFKKFSEENRLKRIKIPAPRGMIFDTNKKLIVDNHPAYDLEVTPDELYSNKDWKSVISKISKIIKFNEESILKILEEAKNQPRFLPVKIKQDLSTEEVALIETRKLDFPGINIQMDIKRTNLYKDLASHVIGYIGEITQNELQKMNKSLISTNFIPYSLGDYIGKAGLEAKWENVLRGINGEEYIEVDALGRRRKFVQKSSITAKLTPKEPVPGKNIILTIDQDLQEAGLKAFEKVQGSKKLGAMIALKVNTGEVLASMSFPSFDPTEFSRGISAQRWNELLNNEYRPLRDKTIQDHYAPGSTFKTITAIAGLEEGEIDEHTTVNCTGSLAFGTRVFHCWKKHGHGTVNVHDALVGSCDVFFYKLGAKLGIDRIAKYAMMLGLGHKTGINLFGEESGLVPTEEWKRKRFNQEWNPGENLMNAIGQSYMLATPLQLANAYAALSTGGQIWVPYLVKQIEDVDGKVLKVFTPQEMNKVNISKRTIDIVSKALFGVVHEPKGTVFGQNALGYDIAGKTGTSQVIGLSAQKLRNTKCENMPFNSRDNGLFVAYAPAHKPEIAVAVVTEHSCHGASGAAPIAIEVIKTYLKKYLPNEYNDEAVKQRAANLRKDLFKNRKKEFTSDE
jgi:penicillin-binding protein 2